MAFDEFLCDRVRSVFEDKHVPFLEKKMMGGVCFMVDDKMCVGIIKDKLMARIGPDIYEESLMKKGCSEMNFTGKPMTGYVFVDQVATDMEEDLDYWVQVCLDFNPKAKSSKKK